MKMIKVLSVMTVLAALTLFRANADVCSSSSGYQTTTDCFSYNFGYCGVTIPTDCQNTTPGCSGGTPSTPSVQSSVPEPSTWVAGSLVALPLAGTFFRILRQRRSSVE
jgi:hypothetical protein